MSNLTILNNSIRSYENLFSLNDLHVASGRKEKHRPNQFIRLETTQELIKEIQDEDLNAQICAFKTIRGTKGGTYACEELVLSYAMWISPKFHLIVLRAFWLCTATSQNNLHYRLSVMNLNRQWQKW